MIDALRVLIAEDEPLVSMMLEDMLVDLGAEIASIVANLPDALAAVEDGDFDCVLLDMNLQGKRADPVAEVLQKKSIPFAILSGGENDAKELGAAVFVPKPYRIDDIEKALAGIGREIQDRGRVRTAVDPDE